MITDEHSNTTAELFDYGYVDCQSLEDSVKDTLLVFLLLLHQLDVFQLNIVFCYHKEPKISLDHGPFSWCLIKFVFFNNVLTWVSLRCRARRGCPYCIPKSNSQGMTLFASFMSIGLTIVSDENINNIWLFPWKRCVTIFFIIIVNSPLSYLWCSGWSKKRLSSKISLGVYSQLREVCQGILQ